MVFKKKIDPVTRAIIKVSNKRAAALAVELGVSRAQIYRIRKESLRSDSTSKKAAIKAGGRPRKVDKRDTRHILRQLKLLRSTEPNWTVKRLMEKSGIKGVSVRTVNRLLNEKGYRYLQARKKGLLSEKDRRTRLNLPKTPISAMEVIVGQKK